MKGDSTSRTRVSLLARLRDQPEDQAAWGEFVDRYAPRVYAWCQHWRLQDADARDVTQNVLLKLAEKLRTFHYDSGGSFRAWLKTLTRHAWSDYVDSQRRGGRGSGNSAVEELLQNVSSGDELAEQLREPFDFELFDAACSRVQDRVDVQSWEAFRLAGLEDLAAATVAEQLDMSVAAVYKAKSRVLKHLQEEIRRLEGDEMP